MRVTENCNCDVLIRQIFIFQILKLIVDTEMENANLVSNLQQTITLVTRKCVFDNQQIAC